MPDRRDGSRRRSPFGHLGIARSEADPASVFSWRGDLTDPVEIDRLLGAVKDHWGPVDCLVANIGSGRGETGPAVDDSEWDRLLAQNLSPVYRIVPRILPQMTARGSGSIVVVASIAALESLPAPMAYSAAKAAVVNYAKNVARDVGSRGVRVNCVHRATSSSRRVMGKPSVQATRGSLGNGPL